MKEIRTEILINAPIEKIWQVLMEFDDWANWSPIIFAASGKAELGKPINMTMTNKTDGAGPQYEPVITTLSAPTDFRWRAKMMASFMFTNDKSFTLTETENGVKLVHSEWFSGLMVVMFWKKLQAEVPSMLNSMNEALKNKVETNS